MKNQCEYKQLFPYGFPIPQKNTITLLFSWLYHYMFNMAARIIDTKSIDATYFHSYHLLLLFITGLIAQLTPYSLWTKGLFPYCWEFRHEEWISSSRPHLTLEEWIKMVLQFYEFYEFSKSLSE